ncbi:MAG: hypothetical protein ACI9VN_003619 [Patescibacteria group bacterium]|jgi:hypothetical protein
MRFVTFIFLLLLGTGPVFSQVDCQPYLPQVKGSIWEITNYNKKGKVTGRNTFELIDKVEDGDEITFTVSSKAFDKKDKLLFDNTFEAKCIAGKFEFDMAYKLEGAMMESFKNMEFTMDASEFEIPPFSAAVGTELPDGSLVVQMDGDSPINMQMTVEITDREVEAKEKITTPAGTFDCLVLTQKTSTKMMVKIKSSSKEWYAENVGIVRTETYNKKGKLMGYSELTKMESK